MPWNTSVLLKNKLNKSRKYLYTEIPHLPCIFPSGFVGGLALTSVWYFVLVLALSYQPAEALVICTLMGAGLSLGLAFSMTVRCLVFLMLPSMFSSKWWRHDLEMLTALLTLCEGLPWIPFVRVTGGFPTQRAIHAQLDVFFVASLNLMQKKTSRVSVDLGRHSR